MDEFLRKIGRRFLICYPLILAAMLCVPLQTAAASPAAGEMQQTQKRLTGTILDADTQTPLIGASVWIKDTSVGTSADINGRFALNVPADRTSVIVVSFIGYDQIERAILPDENNITLSIGLQSDDIEAVQVVGFGTQRRESVIGSISTVATKDLKIPTGTISTNLAGRLSGIVSVQRNGEPGEPASFWIRGISTFGAGQNPLILVDGVERALDLLDPEEIESFSVLKDATATAVYGVRGANGVVLITTRRGEEGRPRINLKIESGMTGATKMPKQANSFEYASLYNEILGYDFYTPDELEAYRTGSDPELYPDVDWMSTVFKDFSASQRYSVNVNGGGSIARYFISGSYYNEDGMFDTRGGAYNGNVKYERYNFRSNLDVNLHPTTVISLTLSGFLEQRNGPPNGYMTSRDDIWNQTFILSPNSYPKQYSDGKLSGIKSALNPWNSLTQGGYQEEWVNTINSLVSLKQDFSQLVTEGLTGTVKFSFDARSNQWNRHTKAVDTWQAVGRDATTGELIYTQQDIGNPQPSFASGSGGNNSTYLEASLNYDRVFDNVHRVGALILYNHRKFIQTASTSMLSLPYKNQGIAGRLTYSYDDRYFVEGNFGYNGSENFAPGHRLGFFPSAAVGWMVSNEKFMEPVSSVISKLKLKASVGQVGNDRLASNHRFIYLGSVTGGGSYAYGTDFTYGSGDRIAEVPNENVSWEVSTKQNYGIEIGLFNKLEIQADVFKDVREGIFVRNNSIPAYVGMTTKPMVNIGKMESKGFDLSAEYNQRFGDFFISARGSFTYSTNTIIEDGEAENAYKYMDAKGQKIYQQRGFYALGLFGSEEEIRNSPTQFSETIHAGLRPGDIKYKDINGDGMIDNYDRIPIGRSDIPETIFGFGFSVNWKGIDLSCFFQGAGRVTVFEQGTAFSPFTASNPNWNGFVRDVYYERWSIDNPDPDARYPRISVGDYNTHNNTRGSSFWQRDGSYLRLKNVELGYSLPRRLTEKIGMDAIRIYFSGVNLMTFSKELKIYDPELGSTDGRKYPPAKVFNFGLNINF